MKNKIKQIWQNRKFRKIGVIFLLILIILPIYFWFSGKKTEAAWPPAQRASGSASGMI